MALLLRSVEVRAVDTEKRTIEGLAVPYGQTIDVPSEGIRERFERGAFGDFKNVPLYWMHEASEDVRATPIGAVIHGEDTEDGYFIRARISETVKGNEVHTLLRDGVVDSLSVGFESLEDKEEDGVTVRSKALLREVSVVTVPAYAGAKVSAVRNEQNSEAGAEENSYKEDIMSEDTKEVLSRVANLEAANEELTRRLDLAGESNKDEAPALFRSAGHFVKELADGNTQAVAEAKTLDRAYTGSVIADSHAANDWKTGLLTIVNQERNILNLFNRGPLGPSGMTVEYAKVGTITGDVAQQVAEGDDLAFMKIDIDTATAPVKTYGAYSQLSLQSIRRSDVPFLQLTLEAQAQSYAKITNGVVRTALTGATPQAGTTIASLAGAKGKDFLTAVMDGVKKIDQNGVGAKAEFLLVSWDVWQQLYTLADTTDRPLYPVAGSGVNALGTVNVGSLVGTFAGFPVYVDYSLAVRTMYVASSRAITTWETAGVPFRLDDENPVNLTKVYSIWGEMAVGVTNANALVKPTFTAA
jgi:hypothetical protein